jgi:hypothetical protein
MIDMEKVGLRIGSRRNLLLVPTIEGLELLATRAAAPQGSDGLGIASVEKALYGVGCAVEGVIPGA